MATSKEIADSFAMIDDFLIDCSIRENHTFDCDVTDYPVESGANISDNIRPLPIVVEIEGLITNTPIGLMRNERVLVTKTPVDSAYELFQAIREERKPVTIRTSMRTYENMAMKSLSIPRGEHENAMRFTASFQQIQTVTNIREIRVSTPIAKNGGGGNGKTVTKPGDPFPGRVILIDKFFKAWWDPDLPGWRKYAKYIPPFEIRTEGTGTATTETVTAKWHLYRQSALPFLTNTGTFGVFQSQVEPTGSVDGGPLNQIIAVHVNQCVLHDFIIKTPPGQKVNNAGTLSGRRTE